MRNIAEIIKLARPLRRIFFGITIMITVGALIDLVMPVLLKLAVDAVTRGGVQFRSIHDLWRYPYSYTLSMLIAIYGLNLVSQALSNLSSRLGDHLAGRLRKFLTETFFEKALTLSQTYYDGELSGKIVNQLNRGVQVITDFFNTATNFIVPSFLQAVFTIALLAYYNPLTALFMTILFPIYIYFSAASTKHWSQYQLKRNIHEDIVRGRISESILNIRLVRGFNNQVREIKTIAEGLTQSNIYFAKQSTTFHIFDFIRNAFLHTILLCVYFLAFLKTFQGRSSFGELILMIQLVNQIRRPLFAMSFVLGRIQEAENGSKEYFNILRLPSREHFDYFTKPQKLTKHTIEFDHVFFAYEQDLPVLDDITMRIMKNETVALVGKSGAGKTTLTNLIMKFYDPIKGEIRMGGISYSELSPTDIRHNIALVFQDYELFSTSVRENVAYGRDASDRQIQDALVKAQAWSFVQDLPKGLDSEIGERGVRLSGGQKQRIQIARAILKNAPILILDEATSSLDAQSESDVQKALEVLMKDRIVLVIAHRFSTICNADRIIVLDKGKIIDQGSPVELSKREGIYQDLLRFQVEGNQKLLESFELH